MKYVPRKIPGMVYEPGYDRALAHESVGEGWKSLIDMIFDHVDGMKNPIRIVQVKEKFGTLRVYTDFINDELDKIIAVACNKSCVMCEQCGAPGELRGKHWLYTACDEHVVESR